MSEDKQIPSLEEVDSYDVPDFLLDRMVKNYDYDRDMARGLVKEAKRMLYLSVKTKSYISPSLKVDDAWHEMLMFTRFYKDFSKFIGGFVHHDPTPGPPDGGKAYARTKENYQETFGEKPSEKYWP